MCKSLKKLNKKLSFLIKIGYTKDIKIEVKRTFVIRFQSVELYDRCLEGSVAYETNISGSDP